MSRSGPPHPRVRALKATSGVEVLVRDEPCAEPAEEPLDPLPDAIVLPEGQSIEERNAFIAELDAQWGELVDGLLVRQDIHAESARDLHQKALVVLLGEYKTLKAIERHGKPAQLTQYVKTVVENAIKNHVGKARPTATPSEVLEAHPDSAPSPESDAVRAERWRLFEGFLDRLSPVEREVFEAKELHGAALEVIATALKRPYQTVVSQHARARRKLQEMAAAAERSSGRRLRRKP